MPQRQLFQEEEKIAKKYNVEDGQFSVFVPLTDKQKNILTKKGVTLEEQFYLDYQLSDESIVRVFKNRETINRVILENGNYPENDNEIILEKRYCAEHNISIGDTVTLGSDTFKVVGTGCVSDYNAPYKNISDVSLTANSLAWHFNRKCLQHFKRKQPEHENRRIYLCLHT